jgi:hypothetical protein
MSKITQIYPKSAALATQSVAEGAIMKVSPLRNDLSLKHSALDNQGIALTNVRIDDRATEDFNSKSSLIANAVVLAAVVIGLLLVVKLMYPDFNWTTSVLEVIHV